MKSKILYAIVIVALIAIIGYEIITLFGIDIIPHKDTGALFCK